MTCRYPIGADVNGWPILSLRKRYPGAYREYKYLTRCPGGCGAESWRSPHHMRLSKTCRSCAHARTRAGIYRPAVTREACDVGDLTVRDQIRRYRSMGLDAAGVGKRLDMTAGEVEAMERAG